MRKIAVIKKVPDDKCDGCPEWYSFPHPTLANDMAWRCPNRKGTRPKRIGFKPTKLCREAEVS